MTVPSDTAKLVEQARQWARQIDRVTDWQRLEPSEEARILLALADALEQRTAERDDARLCHLEALADRDRLTAERDEARECAESARTHARLFEAALRESEGVSDKRSADRDRLAAALQDASDKLPDPMHPEFPRRFVDAQVDALAIIDDALAAAAGKAEA